MPAKYQIYTCDTPAICLKYTWDMSETYVRYVISMPDTLDLRDAWDVPDICLQYAWDLLKTH